MDGQLLRGSVILVVDDDADTVQTVSTMVRDVLGYDVLCASSGHEALRVIDTGTKVDLLLADIMMPRMDGITLTQLVKQRFPDLPVVLSTGLTRAVKSAEGAGAVALIKPYTLENLHAVISEQLLMRVGAGAEQKRAPPMPSSPVSLNQSHRESD